MAQSIFNKMFSSFIQFFKNKSGFSLVELAIVMLIAGLMFAPVYTLLFQVTKLEPDNTRFEIIQEALAEHLRVTGFLPCPADPTLDAADDSTAYSSVNCAAGAAGLGGVVSSPSGDLLIGALPIDNLRAAVKCPEGDDLIRSIPGMTNDVLGAMTKQIYSLREVIVGDKAALQAGAGDYDGDGTLEVGTKTVDDIRCLRREYIVDEYGSKIIYAVSTEATLGEVALTNFTPGFDMFDPTVGEIAVHDSFGNLLHDPRDAATDPDLPIENGQVYVMLSVGPDRKGSWELNGNRSGLLCRQALGKDNENCDVSRDGSEGALPGDAGLLVFGGIHPLKVFAAMPYADVVGVNHFDDRVSYGISGFLKEESFWQWGGGTAGGRDMILGRVAGGPQVRLMIDPVDTASPLPVAADDVIVVNRGQVQTSGRLEIDSDASAITTVRTQGGDVDVSEKTNARNGVTSEKFCYDPPLTSGC